MNVWQGRCDSSVVERFHQAVHCCSVEQLPNNSNRHIVLVGFACDEGVFRNNGRCGAALGPQAIRLACCNLSLPSTFKSTIYDVGDISCQDHDLLAAQLQLAAIISKVIAKGHLPVVLGGGHETSWGCYLGVKPYLEQQKLWAVNFDAHFDTRPLLADGVGSSGTSFRQIITDCEGNSNPYQYTCFGLQERANTASLFAYAQQKKISYLCADKMAGSAVQAAKPLLVTTNNDCLLYLSFCLDVVASSYCPGVSAPQVLGLTPQQVLPLWRHILTRFRPKVVDIAELCPPYDLNNQTAAFAAMLITELILLLQ